MSFRNRVKKGVPTAGQFAAEQRSESEVSLSDPQAVANLNRPFAAVTAEQAEGLRRPRKPLAQISAERQARLAAERSEAVA